MFVNKSSLLIIVIRLIDHNINVILRYFFHFSCAFGRSLQSRELWAILPILKSCSVKSPAADPSCNVKTAATECYTR